MCFLSWLTLKKINIIPVYGKIWNLNYIDFLKSFFLPLFIILISDALELRIGRYLSKHPQENKQIKSSIYQIKTGLGDFYKELPVVDYLAYDREMVAHIIKIF